MNHPIDNVTVLGAGVLGGQIAWHAAFKGKMVTVYEPYIDAIAHSQAMHKQYAEIYRDQLNATADDIKATRDCLTFVDDLTAAVRDADLVIEAVPEDPELKRSVYERMQTLLQPHTLITTNSSSLMPSSFAGATGRPDRYCALHFANLIWALNVVELMAQSETSDETLEAVAGFAIEIGMVPVPVLKERSGYILNSWLLPMLHECLTLVADGVGTHEDIDRTYLKVNPGVSMGPFGLADVIGMNSMYTVFHHLGTVTENPVMVRNADYVRSEYLDKGLLGIQSGEGFYSYPDPAFASPDFQDVPDISAAKDIAQRAARAKRSEGLN